MRSLRLSFQSCRNVLTRLVATTLLVVVSACATQQAGNQSRADEGRDVFGRKVHLDGPAWNTEQDGAVRVPKGMGPDAWTIVLTAARTDDPKQSAHLLEQVRTVGQLPDAFVMQRNGKPIIAVGGFQSPTDTLAKIELERVRSIQIDGEFPYAHAFLAPPSGDLSRGSIPEYDLRNARAQYGSDIQYSLQIAVYGREDSAPATAEERRVFRTTAEQAATTLRQSGELAFYYHGPTRSMVTIGVFTDNDHRLDRGLVIESPRLKALRQRHPKNLQNGRTIVEKVRSTNGGFIERDQKSFLVSIP
jgi:hypothetical protein